MAGGQPLRLGPFTGGLNLASDPTAIADAELASLLNFELDIDGSLISRPPIQEQVGHRDWDERILLIGEAIFSGDHYLIGSNSNGVYQFLNDVWTVITTTFQAAVAVQYTDKVYLVPRPGSGNGGKWDPVGGFVAVAAIPKGQAAVVHKERLYICPGSDSTVDTSRLKFSDPGNFDSWPAPNFIDVGQGDGTKLVDLTVYQDNILLFKNQSSYLLSYDIRPADAVVRKISTTIGAEKQFNVVNYENQVYVIHNSWVYEIINFDFNRLNTKVPFVRDETVPSPFSAENIILSIVEDRLICRFYSKIYVYGLRTRTWSEWKAEEDVDSVTGYAIGQGTSLANNYLVATDSDAADINVDDTIKLYTTAHVLKETTEFTVTKKNSIFGFTNIEFLPAAKAVTVSGDILVAFARTVAKSKAHFFGPIIALRKSTGTEYYAGACITAYRSVFKIVSKQTSTDKETTFGNSPTIVDTFTRTVTDSWSNTDTAHGWNTGGGVAANFDVTGTEGTHSNTTVNDFRTSLIPSPSADTEQVVTFKSSALAAGASQIIEMGARFTGHEDCYLARVEFSTTAQVTVSIRKKVANVQTVLATLTTALTHVANTYFKLKFRVKGSNLFAKVWLASSAEPVAWSVEATDVDWTAALNVGVRDVLATGNTNVLPVLFTYDDYSCIDLSSVDRIITCSIQTKNFDMAVSHQFKRLWWWGADVSTGNDILGVATPIIVAFAIKWGRLQGMKWGLLQGKPWGQLLSSPQSIETDLASTGGVQKKFAKFYKSLRYRQINFSVVLTTNGSTSDGPARLFTLIAITETKQAVPKTVN